MRSNATAQGSPDLVRYIIFSASLVHASIPSSQYAGDINASFLAVPAVFVQKPLLSKLGVLLSPVELSLELHYAGT